MKVVDEWHDVDATFRKIARSAMAQNFAGVRVEKKMVEIKIEGLPGSWIRARPAMDFHLLRFDGEKADEHMRELRFGLFGESCGIERGCSRFGFDVKLWIDPAIDFGLEGKNGAG